ncbi:MAG TPA: DUF1552 domain-containing protein [Bryobacteraceae bacterium]|nr:DUF1552 domain-containing protein [Bryobacteraceae bacterium]
MTYLTKKSLSRRTLLRGMGATVALPLLDSMVPAMRAATKQPPRLGWVYVSNGIIQKQFIPTKTGYNFDLPPILQPLAKYQDQINVLSGLSQLEANTKGDGSGDHTRASAAWLTGVHAYDRTRPGVPTQLAVTADQWAARTLGQNTPLPSLELTVDTPSQGSCDSGDCFYVNTISWRSETTPNMPENHPRIVFERLFGDGGSNADRIARAKATGSILDSVAEEAASLAASLGRKDKSKLGEYLDSVREIEKRIQSAEAEGAERIELPERPIDIPNTLAEHTKLMFDLQILAFQADITRVFTFILARELSLRPYPSIGVPEPHHSVSHHRDDPELVAKKARIDTYHIELFSYLIDKMKNTPDGDGSLLDHSLILYGGGMGNGNLHRHEDLPCILAGKAGGKFKTGQHVAYKMDTPMTNLLLAMLDNSGVHLDKLGDSTGPLPMEPLSVG